jgi:hypothetical protein
VRDNLFILFCNPDAKGEERRKIFVEDGQKFINNNYINMICSLKGWGRLCGKIVILQSAGG